MSEYDAKATDREWEVDSVREPAESVEVHDVDGMRLVATVYGDDAEDAMRRARKVAALPDLLAALESLSAQVSRAREDAPHAWKDHACDECHDETGWCCDEGTRGASGFRCARHLARAALIKARGTE